MSSVRTIVIGTGNKHKVQEIAPLLLETGLPIELKPASDYGTFDPEETGTTLEENALIKARAALDLSGEWSISDDTGLEVDALGGRPGIYAARYAGEGCSFDDNINKLLGELKGVPLEKRTAKFASVIALCRPGQPPQYFRGECNGFINVERRGTGGFGYDPIFMITSLNKSFAELTTAEKNTVSHRSIAVKKCRAELERLI
ncbi:MAG TPA: RdgB/HAM1 family non-canonical purine NTP pyrophosphatase [Planctomycetota bacterium]|nr:RdgB/HAM1 family non-canonical purine NTP pyrophosphatase [Planctomycetota bacterium]